MDKKPIILVGDHTIADEIRRAIETITHEHPEIDISFVLDVGREEPPTIDPRAFASHASRIKCRTEFPNGARCQNPNCRNLRATNRTHCSADCYQRHYGLGPYKQSKRIALLLEDAQGINDELNRGKE